MLSMIVPPLVVLCDCGTLAGDPPIILADEPTVALDSKTGAEIMDNFRRLNEQGRTIIVITHDRQVAKRVVRFRDGRLLQ